LRKYILYFINTNRTYNSELLGPQSKVYVSVLKKDDLNKACLGNNSIAIPEQMLTAASVVRMGCPVGFILDTISLNCIYINILRACFEKRNLPNICNAIHIS
jgi:hypothetical protein